MVFLQTSLPNIKVIWVFLMNKFIEKVRSILYEPNVLDVDVDAPELIKIHSEMLQKKPLLKSTFTWFYRRMMFLRCKYLNQSGLELELGSGVGFFKSINPMLITSDVRSSANVDMLIDAQNINLPSESVSCVYAINVLHHIPNPELFFDELSRVLISGGGSVLVEPHGGFCSSFLHKYMHKDEHFDKTAINWISNSSGPLSGANQALSYIIFERDIDLFNKKYAGRLHIEKKEYCINSIRYLLSGGLNFRQLVPNFLLPFIILIEYILKPISKLWSLHQIVIIKKI